MLKPFLALLALVALHASSPGFAQAEPFPGTVKFFAENEASYARGALVAAGQPLYFTAGTTPGEGAPLGVKAQALVTLGRLKANLTAAGLTLNDVVFVRAYLVPGVEGRVDYAGWDAAWDEFFAPAAPHKPARTTVGVPFLGRESTLIEIEFVCAPPLAPGLFASSDKLGLPVTNPNLKPYGTKEGRIYTGMGIAPATPYYWTAGTTPPVLKPDGPKDSPDYYGDMKTQAQGILNRLKDNLDKAGLTFRDVIFLRAFVGPDTLRGGKFDYEGWNTAYAEFFNKPANPHKPARTTVTTPGYSSPGMMLEIELLAAFPGAPEKVTFDQAATPGLKAFGDPKSAISAGLASRAGNRFYFSAGATAGADSTGDLKTQALEALTTLKTRLAEAGLGPQDVTFLRAYIVPEATGGFDRKAWSEAYGSFFNTPAQPLKPARTTIQVHSLPRPNWKIMIDVIAAAP